MKISLFGSLADAIGREVELDVADGASAGDVRRHLMEAYPAAAALLARREVRACVNDRMVEDGERLGAGAELAFLPPVSGG